ncbi:hypothetical protein PENTCL1PPCAC_14579 [Pristionchus entomophagus]|uniref:Uncharacterized protein n=1 Tax=Pristionchus entomophagus TaxID=358040 RepID=A0AAV5TAR1_9BILA|nr:hypothetical protein PENTCL1PPCAC_14579 [Pristionchus entomophagus]
MQIPADLFFQVITRHKTVHVHSGCVMINWVELKHAMEIITSNAHVQTVRLTLTNSSVANWLNDDGITMYSRAGDTCREFELISNRIPHKNAVDTAEYDMQLRYKQCFVRIRGFSWAGGDHPILVSMSNCEM